MDTRVTITAAHKGRFTFRICRIPAPPEGKSWVQQEQEMLTDECFNQHLIWQADVPGSQAPYEPYWYLPWSTTEPYSDPYTSDIIDKESFRMFYKLPTGLECDGVNAKCIIQWHYLTGNSCQASDTPPTYWTNGLPSCGANASYPEEFWNCADIAIVPQGTLQSPPPPAPSPPPPPPPPPRPSPLPALLHNRRHLLLHLPPLLNL